MDDIQVCNAVDRYLYLLGKLLGQDLMQDTYCSCRSYTSRWIYICSFLLDTTTPWLDNYLLQHPPTFLIANFKPRRTRSKYWADKNYHFHSCLASRLSNDSATVPLDDYSQTDFATGSGNASSTHIASHPLRNHYQNLGIVSRFFLIPVKSMIMECFWSQFEASW